MKVEDYKMRILFEMDKKIMFLTEAFLAGLLQELSSLKMEK